MNIPDGWYRLKKDTLIVEGDYCIYKRDAGGSDDLGNWERCMGLVNRKVDDRYSDNYIVIREGKDPSVPPPEKEWLNPWD